MNLFRVLICFILLQPVWALASESHDDNVLWLQWLTPVTGMEADFESGLKRHHDWRREQGDTWAWVVWKIESGQRSGTYGLGTFDHRWEDYDQPPVDRDAARANFENHVMPYVASAKAQWFLNQKDVERLSPSVPRPFSMVHEFRVKYDKARDFMQVIRQFHAAISQQEWPVYYQWYELYNGGDIPTYARVQVRPSFADIGNQEKNLRDILSAAYGEQKANELIGRFFMAVESESNRLAKSRNDLSYFPPAPPP